MRAHSSPRSGDTTVDRSARWRRVLPTAAVIGAAALTGSAGAPFLGQGVATAVASGPGSATVNGALAPDQDRPHSDPANDRYTDQGDGTWAGAWGAAGDPGWHRDGAESKKRTDQGHAQEKYTAVPCDPDKLIAAITAANAAGGGRLSLAERCRYTLTINLDGNGLPEILAPIKIRGSGATIVRAASAEAFRIFAVGVGGDPQLRDLRIKGGQSDGDGGGIFVAAGGRLRLDHVTMADNISTGDDGDGGGISNEGESTITQNISANDGGGVHNDGAGSVTIQKSVIAKNHAGDTGGGVENDGTALKIAHSVVHGNNAVDDGGGVFACAGATLISHTAISGNQAGDTGGGVGHLVGVSGTMTDVTISRNTAGSTGGGIAVLGGDSTVTVADSKIVENTAVAGAGGGVWIEDDGGSGNEIAIRRTAISRNQATGAGATGGGIYNGTNNTMTLTNARVVDNLANTAPGGVDNRGTITVLGKVVIVGNRPTNCVGSPNPVPTCAG